MTELDRLKADKPKFVKYPKIEALLGIPKKLPISDNIQISIFEKIDGGNCQIRRHNGRLLPGSRGHYIGRQDTASLDWFRKLCKWTYPNSSLYNLPEDIVVFGEWVGNHTLNYGNFNDRFVFIDAFDIKTNKFLDYAGAVSLLQRHNIKGMHILEPLFEGEARKADMEKLVMEPSRHYVGPKEGVVVKVYQTEPQVFFKAYHPDFAESSSERFGEIDHLTSIRFRKAFYGLREELDVLNIQTTRLISAIAANVEREHKLSYSSAQIKQRLDEHVQSGKLEDLKSYLVS